MTKILDFDGYKIEVNPISPLVQQAIEGQYKKKNPEPIKPTYTVEAAGGVVETFEHDETTIDTPEEKEAYAKWKSDYEKWNGGLVHKVIRMFLLKGLTLKLTPEQEESLAITTELLGFDVPTTQMERELFYLETFIVNTQQKLEIVMAEVLAATGVKQEVLEQAESLF